MVVVWLSVTSPGSPLTHRLYYRSNNQIGDSGAVSLAPSVASLTKMQFLYLK